MARHTSAVVCTAVAVLLGACSAESVRVPTSLDRETYLAKGGPSPTDIKVTTTVFDTGALGTLLLMRSDQYNGTGFATYVTSGERQPLLTSHLTPDGTWQLLLNRQAARTLFLVLASQGIVGVPDGNYSDGVEAYARCFNGSNVRVSLLDMVNGASNGNCTLGLDFKAGGIGYKFAMGPDNDAASPSGRATVTCTSAANGSCSSWTIAPNPSTVTTFTLTNGQIVSAPVANLYVSGKSGWVFKGSYHNSYSISVVE